MDKTKLINALVSCLDTAKVLQGEQLADRYHHIWKMNEPLQAVALVLPASTEELSEVLKVCHAHKQPVA